MALNNSVNPVNQPQNNGPANSTNAQVEVPSILNTAEAEPPVLSSAPAVASTSSNDGAFFRRRSKSDSYTNQVAEQTLAMGDTLSDDRALLRGSHDTTRADFMERLKGLIAHAEVSNRYLSMDLADMPRVCHWAIVWMRWPCAQLECVNLRDGLGSTLLMQASEEGCQDLVWALVLCGAEPNAQDNEGRTALSRAAMRDNVGIIDALLGAGSDVNLADSTRTTPLMLAAGSGHLRIVQALIDGGADVNVDTSSDMNALMFAVLNGHLEVSNQLLHSGANASCRNMHQETASSLAAKNQHDVLFNLIDSYVDGSERQVEPLISAAEKGYLEVVKLLIKVGRTTLTRGTITVGLIDDALQMSRSNDHKELSTFLEFSKLITATGMPCTEQDIALYEKAINLGNHCVTVSVDNDVEGAIECLAKIICQWSSRDVQTGVEQFCYQILGAAKSRRLMKRITALRSNQAVQGLSELPGFMAAARAVDVGVTGSVYDWIFSKRQVTTLGLSITGDGFFEVEMPEAEGGKAFTRDGSFKVCPKGKVITTDGYAVANFPAIPANTKSVTISTTGMLTIQTPEGTQTAQLQIARFMDPKKLQNLGENLYESTAESGQAVLGSPGSDGFGSIQQESMSDVDRSDHIKSNVVAEVHAMFRDFGSEPI